MSLSSEMDAFKDIPGYKAILKSVLKSQIQLLIEQLADQTGEESIILTASINDGTLSHLGSSTGKGFLEGRDEMKSQFLGYCLKTHHRKKTQETKSPPYQRSNQRHSPYRTPAKQSRVHPVSLQKARSVDNSSAVMQDSSVQNIDPNKTGGQIKQEEDEQLNRETPDFSSTPTSFPSSLQLSHTQTSADLNTSGQGNSEGQGQSGENLLVDSDETSNSATNIKIEPITENDMELEITGVEPGNTSLTQEDWGQGSVGYGSAGAEGDSSVNQSVETSNYNIPSYTPYPQAELSSNDVANDYWHQYTATGPQAELSSERTPQGLWHQDEISSQAEMSSMRAETVIDGDILNKGKLHVCLYCSKTFTSNNSLERHLRIHTGERPFVCHICSRAFNQKASLKRHISAVH